MTNNTRNKKGSFIVTKEHKRFTEFANAVRKHQYIGFCFGNAGVGKTLSACHYSKWDLSERLLLTWGVRDPSDSKVYSALSKSKTVFYTPSVKGPLTEVHNDIDLLINRVAICIEQHTGHRRDPYDVIELVIIDESEHLSTSATEYLRDVFDRNNIGLIFIGMPGIEKRMSRYPQLYSRVGFAHNYRNLSKSELSFVLTRHWKRLGLLLNEADFTDNQAIAAIYRLTGGNFRLLNRLFIQMDCILRINELNIITEDVVEAASSTLVIGAT